MFINSFYHCRSPIVQILQSTPFMEPQRGWASGPSHIVSKWQRLQFKARQYGSWGCWLLCYTVSPFSQSRFYTIISAAHRYRYKSIGCEPDEAWLSHTGSWGAEGQTTLIDFSAGSLNVSVCVTTSDLGHRNKMQKERAF